MTCLFHVLRVSRRHGWQGGHAMSLKQEGNDDDDGDNENEGKHEW